LIRTQTDLGVIITNRNRPGPLNACLRSIAAQTGRPAWVVIADLGSDPWSAAVLEELADCFMISYLQIDYPGTWNQGLAFNTALRHMPAAGHVIQLDADFILHPYMLEFTQRGLRLVDAMCCVPSYVDVLEVPEQYDGSVEAFSRLLGRSYGGNKLSRGGYVVMPRDWMLANGSYDEAYQGWGFEDADLWWRAEQQLRTYEEFSGSLAIHQSHERQPGVGKTDGNSNWERYQQRISGLRLAVNSHGFGGAVVRRKVIRRGICSLPEIGGMAELPPGRPRTRQGKRLRPAHADVTRCEEKARVALEIAPGKYCNQMRADLLPVRSTVSVLVVLEDATEHVIAASLGSLLLQTVAPTEVIFIGETAAAAWWCSQYVGRFENCGSMGTVNGAVAGDADVLEATKLCDPRSRFRLAMRGGWILNPRMLETLCSLGGDSAYNVSGRVYVIPPVANELSLLDGIPWEAWGSVAHLETQELGRWEFHAKAAADSSTIHQAFSSVDSAQDRMGASSGADADSAFVRHVAEDLILCICSPRKVDLPEVYG
jgi:hypothetical protein